MKKSLSLALAALAMTLPAFAEDAEDTTASTPVQAVAAKKQQFFSTLSMCRYVEGVGEVRKPGASAWEALVEQRYYPHGSTFRAGKGSKVVIALGRDCTVKIEDGASFGTLFQPVGQKTRTLLLKNGTVFVKVPTILPDGLLSVTGAGFTVKNINGESKISYEEKNGDGTLSVVHCITGGMQIEGRHFLVKDMRAADSVRIRTSNDLLFTELIDLTGDYNVDLSQGSILQTDLETQESTVVEKTLSWKMSPKNAVRIFRIRPDIGERMSVSVMTFDAAGNLKNRCAFAENLPFVNSGELVLSDEKSGDDEAAKLAAEVTETIDVEIDDDDEEVDESSDASGSDGADVSGDDGDSASDDSSDDASDDAGDDDDF